MTGRPRHVKTASSFMDYIPDLVILLLQINDSNDVALLAYVFK